MYFRDKNQWVQKELFFKKRILICVAFIWLRSEDMKDLHEEFPLSVLIIEV